MKKTIQLLMLLSFFNMKAQWSNNLSVNTPVCTAIEYSSFPNIVSDNNGGCIIAWNDERTFNTDGSHTIYAQKLDSNGIPQWAIDGVLVIEGINYLEPPTMISDGNGGAIFVWKDYMNATENDIFAQKINSNGIIQWPANGVVVCSSPYDQISPKLVSDNNGGAVITWQDKRNNTDYNIYAQKINSLGVNQWIVNGVSVCSAIGDQTSPALTNDNSGNTFITWKDNRDFVKMYIHKINSLGNDLWTTNGVLLSNASVKLPPNIVSDNNGGAIVGWEADNSKIIAQKVDANGNLMWTFSGKTIININNYANKIPSISPDGTGGAFIQWKEFLTGTTYLYDIKAQRIDTNGNLVWNTSGITFSSNTNIQSEPAITTSSDDGLIITWSESRSSSINLFTQKISTLGNILWTSNGEYVTTKTNADIGGKIIKNNNGGCILAWFNTNPENIFSQYINSQGTLSIDAFVTNESLQIYPNPVKNELNFKTTDKILKIEVYDITGKLIKSSSFLNENIKLFDLKTGQYFIKVFTEKGIKTAKIVKE